MKATPKHRDAPLTASDIRKVAKAMKAAAPTCAAMNCRGKVAFYLLLPTKATIPLCRKHGCPEVP